MIPCPICSSRVTKQLDITSEDSHLHRCLGCGIIRWDRQWPPGKTVEFYHDYYANRSTELSQVTGKRYHAILQQLERHQPPGSLLEVGCGMGYLLGVAEVRGWRPVGLEISSSGRKQIERLKAERGWTFQVQEGDVMCTEFPTESFKATILIEVLEHLIDPIACLKKVHRWLEPHGLLYMTTPNFDSLSRYALAGRWRAIAREHLCLFNPITLNATLKMAGFRVIRLVTKNIDIPEILAKWRHRGPSGASVKTEVSTEVFRHAVERSTVLRALKRVANATLQVSRLGEVLEVFAVKATASCIDNADG